MECPCTCHKTPGFLGLCLCCSAAAQDFFAPPSTGTKSKSEMLLDDFLKGKK